MKKPLTTVPAVIPLPEEKIPPEESWLGVRDAAGKNNYSCAVMSSKDHTNNKILFFLVPY